MNWFFLIIAGIFEIIWAVCLKYTYGFTKFLPSVITIAAMAASFGFLAQALKTIPIGNAYAVWTGIGAVGVAIIGIFLFGECADVKRLVCIGLIVAGIVGLKLFAASA